MDRQINSVVGRRLLRVQNWSQLLLEIANGSSLKVFEKLGKCPQGDADKGVFGDGSP